ncbi:hypothetical protein MNV84_00777 [Leishmania braziliensis]|nr:hypothetical protein MNV84_00777 [Leishmania braziliensis]
MCAPAKAQPLWLFDCLLLLASNGDEYDDQTGTVHKSAASSSLGTNTITDTAAVGAARLYFTEGGPAGNLAALQRYLKVEEAHSTSPLLRVLQLAPQAPTCSMRPLVYVEQDTPSADSPSREACARREAVLTTCSGACTMETMPSRWYQAPVEAVLCVFQDFASAPATPTTSRSTFWAFLDSVVRYHARDFDRGVAQVELQCIFMPTFETEQSAVYSRDLFGDYVAEEAQKHGGAAAERRSAMKVCVESSEALERVMAYVKRQWPILVANTGSSHLVVYTKWSPRSPAACNSNHLRQSAAGVTDALEQTACFVWLQNDAVGGGRDGVYADAALEALLDELSLAAASISTPSEADAVLQEEGVSAFFEECCLTHTLKKVICKHFQSVVRRQRPLFHWILSLPPHSRLSTSAADAAVTAVLFENSAAASRAVWGATELLVHWQQLSDTAHALAKKALQQRRCRAGGLFRQIVSAPPRIPRQHRTIQQSGLHCDSFSGASVLDRQRRKLNVPHLYGIDERQSTASSLNSTQREPLLAASGLFHSLRSFKADSLDGTSMLDTEEVFGSYPKLTKRVVKRVAQSRTTVHAVQ